MPTSAPTSTAWAARCTTCSPASRRLPTARARSCAHARQTAKPLAEIRPDAPVKLTRILEGMLAKDPAQPLSDAGGGRRGGCALRRRRDQVPAEHQALRRGGCGPAPNAGRRGLRHASVWAGPLSFRHESGPGRHRNRRPGRGGEGPQNGELIEIIDAKSKRTSGCEPASTSSSSRKARTVSGSRPRTSPWSAAGRRSFVSGSNRRRRLPMANSAGSRAAKAW